MRVRVDAPVWPTEDPDRVRAAATAFVAGEVQSAADAVVVRGHDLGALRQRIWEHRIIDTVRGALLAGVPEGSRVLRLRLSKQAAVAGRLGLPVGRQPLGDLLVTMEVEPGDAWPDARALAWWLCPETRDGQIVGPTD